MGGQTFVFSVVVLAVFGEIASGQCPAGSIPDGSTTECFTNQVEEYSNRCRRGSFCAGGATDEPGLCCKYSPVNNGASIKSATTTSQSMNAPCPPVCAIWCEFGNVMVNGCPTCTCNPSPAGFNGPVSYGDILPSPVSNPCPAGSYEEEPSTVCQPSGVAGSSPQCPRGSNCVNSGAGQSGYCCKIVPTNGGNGRSGSGSVASLTILPEPCPPRSVEDGTNTVCWSTPTGVPNAQCKETSFCSGPAPGDVGKCCSRLAPENPAHCPIDTSVDTCKVKMNTCDSYRPCRNGFKCCPKVCGNRCVPINGEVYQKVGG